MDVKITAFCGINLTIALFLSSQYCCANFVCLSVMLTYRGDILSYLEISYTQY